MFGISEHVLPVPQIRPHLLELQVYVTLWMKAQHRLGTNENKQMADLFMDSHPVGLLVALIAAEDKIISGVHTPVITVLTPLVNFPIPLYTWNFLGNTYRI